MNDSDVRSLAAALLRMISEHGGDGNGFSVGELTQDFRRRMAYGKIGAGRLDDLRAMMAPHGFNVDSYEKGCFRTSANHEHRFVKSRCFCGEVR